MAGSSSGRRAGQIAVAVAIGVVLFFGLGEILARSLNLVDRLNNFPRQLYEATDDEDLPYVLRGSIDTMARGRRVVIDENRMRVAPESAEYPKDARRILVLGDSVAFGYMLDFDDTLGARLETEMEEQTGRPHRVLNGGVEGYNTQNQLAWLRRYGRDLEPEALVVVFNLNDYDYGPVMGANGVLTTDRTQRVSTWSLANVSDFYVLLRWLYKIGAQQLTAPAEEAPTEKPASESEAGDGGGQDFLKFDRFVSILRKRYYAEPNDERWPEMIASLRGLRDEARDLGVPLLVAILPDGDQIGVVMPDLVPQERLAEICRDEGLDCIDLRPAFEKRSHEGPLFLDIMHPNAKGHGIVAGEIAPRLAGALP